MANPEHVALAKRNSFAIARWREQNWRRRARLDLSSAYLSGVKLPSVDLAHDDLSSIDLTNADLHGANLSGTNLQQAFLSRSNLAWVNLLNANLKGASLVRANLKGAVLRGAALSHADLSYADLSLADLSGANLQGADLTQVNLFQADLTGATLGRTNLTAATLDIANLSGVDLRHASLVHTSLDGTLLAGARLELTLFGDCDLGRVLGLSSTRHHGPSIIGLDTLIRSKGLIPASFLRESGVPEALIHLQGQMKANQMDISRVLLVGSVEDSAFIQRVQADLRAAGLSCWYLGVDDEEGLLEDGGSPTAQRLDYYDQMVLVCSEHALESPYGWRVFEQIMQSKALDNSRANRVIPLGLDRGLQGKPGKLCEALRRQPVVDFTDWQQQCGYDLALERLVEALKEKPVPFQPELGPLSPVID